MEVTVACVFVDALCLVVPSRGWVPSSYGTVFYRGGSYKGCCGVGAHGWLSGAGLV